MEDLQIIELYHTRTETAINETGRKYGRMLHSIAWNILNSHEDTEETVNDTYSKAWNSMPPQRPNSLCAYLGRITRNLSINRWHEQKAQKRFNGADVLLSELSDCIPTSNNVETEMDTRELTQLIDRWLSSLSADDRVLFLRRYWFCDSLAKLAEECATTPNKLAGRMFRLRLLLKNTLETEGISL